LLPRLGVDNLGDCIQIHGYARAFKEMLVPL
jgi:hypothetical protein